MSDLAVADKGSAADAGAGDTGNDKGAADEQSILDGAHAPAKTGEPKGEAGAGKSADAAGKQADGTAKAGNKDSAGKPDASKPTGAPEKYSDFTVPDGVKLSAKAVEQFQAVAKELNLSQDAAQKLVDFQVNAVKDAEKQNLSEFKAMQKEWADNTRKELGANADKELSFAATARDKFAPEGSELRKVLNDSGLANHVAVVKHFIAIGKAIGEDTLTEGGDRGKGDGTKDPSKNAGKTAAQVIYPDHK